jgi:ParB-like chromosome segregation protein Spo0J
MHQAIGGKLRNEETTAEPILGRAHVVGLVTTVRVDKLSSGFSPRRTLNLEHVTTLVEVGGQWPPLLVHRSTMKLIDGAHRLAAAERLGMVTVQATMFDGSEDEARVEAIRRNVEHGLPLTLLERKRGATELLRGHFGWSDRRIAAICGLSPKTVGRVREAQLAGRHDDQPPTPEVREGRDRRLHPVTRSATRERIAVALADAPDASLRTIAVRVGASPETVRSVRKQLSGANQGADVMWPRFMEARSPAHLPSWEPDAAIASTTEGSAFADWFSQFTVSPADCRDHAANVPLSRIYEVIDEIARRASVWDEFAGELKKRLCRK